MSISLFSIVFLQQGSWDYNQQSGYYDGYYQQGSEYEQSQQFGQYFDGQNYDYSQYYESGFQQQTSVPSQPTQSMLDLITSMLCHFTCRFHSTVFNPR